MAFSLLPASISLLNIHTRFNPITPFLTSKTTHFPKYGVLAGFLSIRQHSKENQTCRCRYMFRSFWAKSKEVGVQKSIQVPHRWRLIDYLEDFEATINNLLFVFVVSRYACNFLVKLQSKWLVAVLLGLILVWKHDGEAMWIASGAVVNTVLNITLKQVLKQERPVPNFRFDPGMPSSHAQSIFFTVAFVILSLMQWLGANELTLVISSLITAFGSYLSWLRISQRFHTLSQVLAGAILGSAFSISWFLLWDFTVKSSFKTTLWVRFAVSFGSAAFPISFVLFVIHNLLKNER